MAVGVVVLGRRYSRRQVCAVALITCGLAHATLATVGAPRKPLADGVAAARDEDDDSFLGVSWEVPLGVGLVIAALLSSALLGACQVFSWPCVGSLLSSSKEFLFP